MSKFVNLSRSKSMLSVLMPALMISLALPALAENSQLSIILPINAAQNPKIALAVSMPKDFQALPNQTSIPEFAMAEFIPANETATHWTKIVTTNSFVNKKLTASNFIQYMQQRFSQDASDVKIIDTTTQQYKDYQKACTTIDYHVNQRHEMVAMCYYSGPYDMAGVQYAMLYPSDNPPASIVASQLEQFINTQTQVLNAEPAEPAAATVAPTQSAASAPAAATVAPAQPAVPAPVATTVAPTQPAAN